MTNQPAKPGLAIPVSNVATSSAFYINCMGCIVAERLRPDIAHLIDSDGDPFLLVGPDAGDPTPYMTDPPYIAKPGEMFRFLGGDLDARRSTLLEKGLKDVQIVETRWDDRSLNLKDPDGYILSFYKDS